MISLTSCASQLAKTKIIDTACTDFEEITLSQKTACFFKTNINDFGVQRDLRSIIAHNKVWKDKCKKGEKKDAVSKPKTSCVHETVLDAERPEEIAEEVSAHKDGPRVRKGGQESFWPKTLELSR